MSRRWCWRVLVLALAYYGGARLGLSLAIYNSQVTPFWPPTGIAIAAMLIWGRSLWPGVAIAAFAINAPISHTFAAPLILVVGNVLAPVVAVTLLRRLSFDTEMKRLRDAAMLVAVGGGSMVISATIGVAGLLVDGLPSGRIVPVWATWWTGDAVGALIVAPFIFCLELQRRSPRPTRGRMIEALGFFGLTTAAMLIGFRSEQGLRFLVFPALAAVAVRFQLRGAAPAALIASLIAARAASLGVGPFNGVSETRSMIALQLFNICVTFTTLQLAAMTADRERARDALARQGDELEQLVEDRTQRLSNALDQLGQAQQIARMGSYDTDLLTGNAKWSDEFYRLMQLPIGAPMSYDIYMGMCHPDEVAMVQAIVGKTIATGEPFTMDHRLRKADGTYRWLHCQGKAVYNDEGVVIATRGTATDIDDRKAAEHRFEQLVEMAPDAMVFVNEEGNITQVNLQTEGLFGYPRAELIGMPIETLIPDRYRGVHRHHREAFVSTPDRRPMGRGLDLLARRRDGTEFPVEISLSPLETDEGQIVSASIRDVTDRKQQQDELAYRGLHDSLTGLPNRLLLADRLARSISGLRRNPGRSTGVIFLDLDRFKWVNDSLGHDAGDTLLRVVASRLLDAVRPGDTVARFGGDEFVVLGEGLDGPDEALAVAERLRSAVSAPVALQEGHVVVPTMSIGVMTTNDPRAEPAALLRDADAAMFRAKDQGRDRIAFFAPEIHAEMKSRLALTGGLRAAIEQGQLRVHYQPIVSLATGAAIAVEALVRWEHPDRGLLLPAEFLELAEETGQVGALDRAVIVTACREFGSLIATNPEASALSLNVNISLRHLSSAQLRDALVQGLNDGNLLPRHLTVEVTESADLSGEQFAELLAMVKELGLKVAIDDFGTGFSALSRLNGLAIDTIKVDRSFVTGVDRSARLQALVAAMTQLSAALDASVVAEGIDLEEQAEVLRGLGCTGGQGFLWSKGVPIDELARWLAARAPKVPSPRRSVDELELT